MHRTPSLVRALAEYGRDKAWGAGAGQHDESARQLQRGLKRVERAWGPAAWRAVARGSALAGCSARRSAAGVVEVALQLDHACDVAAVLLPHNAPQLCAGRDVFRAAADDGGCGELLAATCVAHRAAGSSVLTVPLPLRDGCGGDGTRAYRGRLAVTVALRDSGAGGAVFEKTGRCAVPAVPCIVAAEQTHAARTRRSSRGRGRSGIDSDDFEVFQAPGATSYTATVRVVCSAGVGAVRWAVLGPVPGAAAVAAGRAAVPPRTPPPSLPPPKAASRLHPKANRVDLRRPRQQRRRGASGRATPLSPLSRDRHDDSTPDVATVSVCLPDLPADTPCTLVLHGEYVVAATATAAEAACEETAKEELHWGCAVSSPPVASPVALAPPPAALTEPVEVCLSSSPWGEEQGAGTVPVAAAAAAPCTSTISYVVMAASSPVDVGRGGAGWAAQDDSSSESSGDVGSGGQRGARGSRRRPSDTLTEQALRTHGLIASSVDGTRTLQSLHETGGDSPSGLMGNVLNWKKRRRTFGGFFSKAGNSAAPGGEPSSPAAHSPVEGAEFFVQDNPHLGTASRSDAGAARERNAATATVATAWVGAVQGGARRHSVAATDGSNPSADPSSPPASLAAASTAELPPQAPPAVRFKPRVRLCTGITRALRKIFHEHLIAMCPAEKQVELPPRPYCVHPREATTVGSYGSKSFVAFTDAYRSAITAVNEIVSNRTSSSSSSTAAATSSTAVSSGKRRKSTSAVWGTLQGVSMVQALALLCGGGRGPWRVAWYTFVVLVLLGGEGQLSVARGAREAFDEAAQPITTPLELYALLRRMNGGTHLSTDSLWKSFFLGGAPSTAEALLATLNRTDQMAVLGHDSELHPAIHLRVHYRSGVTKGARCDALFWSTSRVVLLRYFLRLLTHCAGRRAGRRERARQCIEYAFAMNLDLYRRYYGSFVVHHRWCRDYQTTFLKNKQLVWRTNAAQVVRYWKKLLLLVALRRKAKIFGYKVEKIRILNERRLVKSLVLHRYYYGVWRRWVSKQLAHRAIESFCRGLSDDIFRCMRRWIAYARLRRRERCEVADMLQATQRGLARRCYLRFRALAVERRALRARKAAAAQYALLCEANEARRALQALLTHAADRERAYAAALVQRAVRGRLLGVPPAVRRLCYLRPPALQPPLPGIPVAETGRLAVPSETPVETCLGSVYFTAVPALQLPSGGASGSGEDPNFVAAARMGAKMLACRTRAAQARNADVQQMRDASDVLKEMRDANPKVWAGRRIAQWWRPMLKRRRREREQRELSEEAAAVTMQEAAGKRLQEQEEERMLQMLLRQADENEDPDYVEPQRRDNRALEEILGRGMPAAVAV